MLNVHESKLQGKISGQRRTGKSLKINLVIYLISIIKLSPWELQTSVNCKFFILFRCFLITTMNDEAKSGSKCPIIFYFCRVFHSRCPVHFLEHEWFHWVDIHQCFDKWVLWILKYLLRQWLREVLYRLCKWENSFPHWSFKHCHCKIFCILRHRRVSVNLGKYNSVQNLIWWW